MKIKPYYKIAAPYCWQQYDELTDRRFETWMGAARALYKEVRKIGIPGSFQIWKIDHITTYGEGGEIVRKYTFTK